MNSSDELTIEEEIFWMDCFIAEFKGLCEHDYWSGIRHRIAAKSADKCLKELKKRISKELDGGS